MNIPFVDLKSQYLDLKPSIHKRINSVLEHGQYIMGPEVLELEEALADYVGVGHCIAVSSGTDALLIALMALGVGRGDEVITTPFTFIATGEVISLLGAKPVFVDIDKQTYNIDPTKVGQAITSKTKAIMPVNLYGQCADFEAINEIATEHGLPVIEDGCQSFGAVAHGRLSCSLSTIGCTSFFPSKPLGGYGDSGACFTDDAELALAMRKIRVHGQDKRYHHSKVGVNGRMDTIQAAILLAKLDVFADEVEARMRVGSEYTKLLEKNCPQIVVPYIEKCNQSVFAQYTISVNNRSELMAFLKEAGIPSAVHYPVGLNKQPALATDEFYLPVSELCSARVMSLPMHPYLKSSDIYTITKEIERFIEIS